MQIIHRKNIQTFFACALISLSLTGATLASTIKTTPNVDVSPKMDIPVKVESSPSSSYSSDSGSTTGSITNGTSTTSSSVNMAGMGQGSFASGLPDSSLVCRGGTCNAGQFTNGSGITTDINGNLDGVSVNSAHGKSLQELSSDIPNGRLGVTTVGQVRASGGDIKPSPTTNRQNHATLSGISANKAEELFKPTIVNPNKIK